MARRRRYKKNPDSTTLLLVGGGVVAAFMVYRYYAANSVPLVAGAPAPNPFAQLINAAAMGWATKTAAKEKSDAEYAAMVAASRAKSAAAGQAAVTEQKRLAAEQLEQAKIAQSANPINQFIGKLWG